MSSSSDQNGLASWSARDILAAVRAGHRPGCELPGAEEPEVARPANPATLACEAEGLIAPRIPEHLADDVQPRAGEWRFSSRDGLDSLYDLETLAAEFRSTEPPADYVALGHSGHGFGSWVFSYALVEQGLGLFLQVPWNGPQCADERGIRNIDRISQWTHSLPADFAAAKRAGRVSHDARLVIVDCSTGGRYWGWATDSGFIRNETLNPLYDAWQSLQ